MDVSTYPAGSSYESNRLHRQLFESLDRDKDGRIWTWELYSALGRAGVLPGDPRIQSALAGLQSPDVRRLPVESRQPVQISFPQFAEIAQSGDGVVPRALGDSLTVRNFPELTSDISEIYERLLPEMSGNPADYIPRLAMVDPNQLGISICTVTGQRFSIGEADVQFGLQSTSKPFGYAMAVEEHGLEFVHARVGHEQSGGKFNELVLDELGRPHNAMINAGAILTSSLIKPGADQSDRYAHVESTWTRLMAAKPNFDNAMYLSEAETGDRNMALAAEMRRSGVLPKTADPRKVAEFYFQLCSMEVDASMLATAAATMAGGGTNPFTNDQVFSANTVRHTLSQMAHSGMYNYSGRWNQQIGPGVLPKSGVSGVLILVVPGVMGVCVFSPNLDENGNSVRGVKFAEMLSEKYALHPYEIPGAKKDLRGRERGAGVAVPAAAVSRSGALGANRQAPQTVLDASRVALDGVTGPTSGRVTGATTSPQVGGTPPSQHSGSGRHRISDTGPEL